MRRLLPALVLVFAGSIACEQRFSSTPSRGPDDVAPAPPGAIDALLAPRGSDAGAPQSSGSHAMVVTLCAADPGACAAARADGGNVESGYRVVFGSGRAELRSRGQAMADLYKELRDRTSSGERLSAQPRSPGDGGALAAGESRGSSGPGGDAEPLSQCAFHLLDLVDGVGEVTLDVVHGYGSRACLVSLGQAGPGQCLVHGADGPPKSERK